MTTLYKTARQSLDMLVNDNPVSYVRGGSIQIVRGALATIGGIGLAAGTLFAVADQHDSFKGVTDSISQLVDWVIPGDTPQIEQAREKTDSFLDYSGLWNSLRSVAGVAGAGAGVYWLIFKNAIRPLGDGVTSLRDSKYEHSVDGKTYKRHGGYENKPSEATKKYGKQLTPVDSQKDLDSLAEGDIAFINGAVLVQADFYYIDRVKVSNNRYRDVREHMTAAEFKYGGSLTSGHNEGNFIFELPGGERIKGFRKYSELHTIARLINDAPDGKPIVCAEGINDNNVLQLAYIRPAY